MVVKFSEALFRFGNRLPDPPLPPPPSNLCFHSDTVGLECKIWGTKSLYVNY